MLDRSSIISEKGCLRAAEEWIEGNFMLISILTLAIAAIQVRHLLSALPAKSNPRSLVIRILNTISRLLSFHVHVTFTFSFSRLNSINHAPPSPTPKTQKPHLRSVITTRGCMKAGEEWFQRNLLFLVFVYLIITFVEVSYGIEELYHFLR